MEKANNMTIKILPKEKAYFKYKVNGKSKSYYVQVRVSPGSEKLVLYCSPDYLYPGPENYQWCTNEAKLEWETLDLNPFGINSEQNLCYSLIPKPGKSLINAKLENLAIAIDGETWKYGNDKLFIGIHNISNSDINADLKIIGIFIYIFNPLIPKIEIEEISLIPKELILKNQIFLESFNEIEGGTLSQAERQQKKLQGSEFTYGEVEFVHFIPLLNFACAGMKPGGVFWDLGCGAGKAILAAALCDMNFSKISGVELLDGLHSACLKAIGQYCEVSKQNKIDPKESRFNIIKGDMRKIDWSDADVIYTSSICFPEDLIKDMVEIGKKLKPGTRIITLKNWGESEIYKTLNYFKVKMTWGKNGVYILEKI